MTSAKYRAGDEAGLQEGPGAGADEGPAGAGEGPQIGALTANNLARHMAYLRESGQQSAGAAGGAAPGPAGEVVRTLAMEDPDLTARRAAYLQRKESKRESRKQRGGMLGSPKGAPGVDSGCFLSNLQEVEADVDYRFSFWVIGAGQLAERVVELACESAAAHKLPSEREAARRPETPSRSSARAPRAQRCLCAVQSPGGGVAEPQKLTKLVFNSTCFGRQLPACSSRLEALGTALVFVLAVDAPGGGAGAPGVPRGAEASSATFEQQLRSLAEALEEQRARTRARLRPVRAVVLCSHADPALAGRGQEAWAAALADFEQAHGDMWKFGPLAAGDGDALHAAFAEMASVRILQGRCGGAAPPGAVPAEEPMEEEAEAEGEERRLLEEQLRERAACGGARKRASSESPSECSEGWQRPPIFEAEFDGSECSEGVLERHAQLHGLDPASVPRAPPLQPPAAWGAEAEEACHPDGASPRMQTCAVS